jgi:hypothetical protein
VALAQSAEHRIVAPKVTGSSPVGHPTTPHERPARGGVQRQGAAPRLLQRLLQSRPPSRAQGASKESGAPVRSAYVGVTTGVRSPGSLASAGGDPESSGSGAFAAARAIQSNR